MLYHVELIDGPRRGFDYFQVHEPPDVLDMSWAGDRLFYRRVGLPRVEFTSGDTVVSYALVAAPPACVG